MAKLINGKEISQQIKDELKEKVSALKAQGKISAWQSFRSETIRHLLYMLEIRRRHARISASSHVRLNFRRRQPRKNFSLLSRI